MGTIVAGIDPGREGAITIFNVKGKRLLYKQEPRIYKLPWLSNDLDVYELAQIVASLDVKMVYLELVHAMPSQGVTSMFTFGKNYGAIMAMLMMTKTPFTLIRPQEWKKTVLIGLNWKKNKKAVYDWAIRRWDHTLFEGPRGAIDLNKCDATAIAYYGYLKEKL